MRFPDHPDCTPAELVAGLWPCASCGQARYLHAPTLRDPDPQHLHCTDRGQVTPMLYVPLPIASMLAGRFARGWS